jgi:hypothetical protein
MNALRLLTKIAGGLAASGAAVAFALSSPVTASATLDSVTVNQLPFVEFASLSGTIAHANGSCDSHCAAVINWGDGSTTTIDDTGANRNDIVASHLYPEEGPYPVSVEVRSWSCGLFCTMTSTRTGAAVETVSDAALSATSNLTFTLAEGDPFNGVVGSFTDANPVATQDDFGATISWGDGSSSPGTINNLGGSRFSISTPPSHVYRTAGTYPVNTHVVDHGSTLDIPATAYINDLALTASGVNATMLAGSPTNAQTAQFTDPNPGALAGDFTANIDWGDNSTSAGTVTQTSSGHFSISGLHTYAYAGIYTATTSIADAGGATATATSTETVQQILLLPAVSNAAFGGYTTSIYIQNGGTSPANISIQYYNQSGAQVGKGDTRTGLAPHANWTVRQDNGNSFAAGAAGWAWIVSNQRISAFVNEFAPNAGDATSYTAIRYPNDVGSTLYEPAIANNAYGGYTTGMGVVNYGPGGDITVTYRDALGVVVKTQVLSNVAAGAYVPVYSGDAALGLPSGFAGTATLVKSGQGVLAAVVNETGPHGQFSSYDAVNAGSTSLFAPVAMNNAYGGFYTGMGVQNTTSTAGTVTVTYYDSAGTPTQVVKSIAANGYLGLYQGDPTDGPPVSGTGYTAQLSSTVPITAIVNEVTPPTGGITTTSTSYNTFVAGASQANLALVESAGSDGWSTGLGVMNTGRGATTVTLSYYDADTGAPIGTPQTQTLQSRAFWGPYQPAAGLPAGVRATAILTTSLGGRIAVICNEAGVGMFMSYSAQ